MPLLQHFCRGRGNDRPRPCPGAVEQAHEELPRAEGEKGEFLWISVMHSVVDLYIQTDKRVNLAVQSEFYRPHLDTCYTHEPSSQC